jgi:hypothetical protein
MNTNSRQTFDAQISASIQHTFALVMDSIHRRLFTNKLNSLVQLGDACIRSGMQAGSPALTVLHKEATTLCEDYAAARVVNPQSLVFTLPALTRLERLASPQASKGLTRLLTIVIGAIGGAILTGICSGLIATVYHLIAGGGR